MENLNKCKYYVNIKEKFIISLIWKGTSILLHFNTLKRIYYYCSAQTAMNKCCKSRLFVMRLRVIPFKSPFALAGHSFSERIQLCFYYAQVQRGFAAAEEDNGNGNSGNSYGHGNSRGYGKGNSNQCNTNKCNTKSKYIKGESRGIRCINKGRFRGRFWITTNFYGSKEKSEIDKKYVALYSV